MLDSEFFPGRAMAAQAIGGGQHFNIPFLRVSLPSWRLKLVL